MARLRQINPGDYKTSAKVSQEFESVLRYLNVIENNHGNKTLAELFSIIFNDEGDFSGAVELRLDTSEGLQYRVGTYDEDDDGWNTIALLDDIRGTPGINVGEIEGAIFFNREDFTATDSQTEFAYTHGDDDALLVFQNGLLLAAADYEGDPDADTVTLDVGAALDDLVTIYTVRATAVSEYRRSDLTAAENQAVFPFVHTEDEVILVYKNGLLQRSGGGYDYIATPDAGTVTFTSVCEEDDEITIFTVENLALQQVTGLMLTDGYCDDDGLILFNRVIVEDNQIPQSKISGLENQLLYHGRVFVQDTDPSSDVENGIVEGDQWIDTSVTPNVARFFDGTDFLRYAPDSSLPDVEAEDAGLFIKVNTAGTGYELGEFDDTALVPKTYMGAAEGVATLDSDGLIPVEQLPEVFSTDTIYGFLSGATADDTYRVKRIYKQQIRIDGIAIKLTSGTCTIEITVDGVVVGTSYAASSTQSQQALASPIEIDALSVSKLIGVKVSAGASPVDVEVGYATANIVI